jgi:sec-independent protein translocase protein TatA
MFRNFGTGEIILILVVVMLLFGAKRMPDAARSLGRSMRIFKSETKALREDDDETPRTGTVVQEPRQIDASAPDPTQARPASETERTER